MTAGSPPTGRKTTSAVPPQRAEGQQRHADFLARLTKEQDERENAEAGERFPAQRQQLSVNRPLKS